MVPVHSQGSHDLHERDIVIAGLVAHVFAYVAICTMLVVVWALGETGSFGALRGFVEDPETLDSADFWPVWVIVTWGAAVVVHLGVVVAYGLFGRKQRRARRRQRAELANHARSAAEAGTRAVTSVADQFRHRRRRSDDWREWVQPGTTGPERRWVTVMFTDIVNSTQLTEALGDEQWTRILRAHRKLVREAILARGGEEVATQGDGFMARFEAPADAVLCGVDVQRAIAEREGDDAVVPAVRIGIHAGEAVEDDGDLVGQVVNLASRVAGEADAGEILVTEPVADYLGTRLSFRDCGVRTLKGISQARHLLAVEWQDDGQPVTEAEPADSPVD